MRSASTVTAIVAVLLLGGCAQQSTSEPTSPSSEPTSPLPASTASASTGVCAAAADLQRSIDALQAVDLGQGVGAARSALTQVQTDTSRLVAAVGAEGSAAVARIEADAAALRTTLGSAATVAPTTTAASVRAQIDRLATDVTSLIEGVAAGCRP